MFRIPSTLGATRATFLAFAVFAADAAASQITVGNLVVVRIGDGVATPTNASTPVFLEEYSTAGATVQTIPLPTAVSGSNNPFANSGVATSEGALTQSADGRYLVQAGYNALPGITGIASTASPTAPRTVARTEISTGTVDTSTTLSGDTSYSGNNIRSAVSLDGTQFWTAGTATSSADAGVRYISALGGNTSVQISATVTNTRVVNIFGGQLYVSSASGSFRGVNVVGTGLPNTSGQTISLLPGFPTTNPSQYDYFFADANTLYVAEDGSQGETGGIEKWTLSGGTWARQYTLSPGVGLGCRGLTGTVSGGVATLYATTTESSSNRIVSVTDTGSGAPFTTVALAQTNTVFRGVRLIQPPTSNTTGTSFCFGDGTGTACPCGNNSTVGNGEGCLNSLGTGGLLAATGTASLANDTVLLAGSGMPNSSALYFQGTSQQSGGLGAVFGDGLRCAGGSIIRLGTKTNAGGASAYPAGGDLSVSVRGLVGAPGSRTYQVWYRNAAAFCTPSTFNLTNGLEIAWTP
jgi:hypothetical protein